MPENNSNVLYKPRLKTKQLLNVGTRLPLLFIVHKEDAFDCRCVAKQNLK